MLIPTISESFRKMALLTAVLEERLSGGSKYEPPLISLIPIQESYQSKKQEKFLKQSKQGGLLHPTENSSKKLETTYMSDTTGTN